jgi:nicotinate-nucleotide pyrophosphorylase (carboxylating)
VTDLIDTVLDEIVARALREDLSGGDLTTEATVSAERRGVAKAVAHGALVLAGSAAFARTFYLVDRGLRVESLKQDGERAEAGEALFIVEGPARSILLAERCALNFLQRLSGVATLTRRFVDALPPNTKTRIVDTRKTTPGLRALERLAVRAGGAHNHRNDLSSAVLIKDNHIVAAGGIRVAIEHARQYAPHTSRIEVEVDSLPQLEEALAAGADIVLLDNFTDSAVEEAVKRGRGRALFEVSGGITLERVARLAALGIDVISVGALTHSAPAADIGLDLELLG